MSDQRRMPGFGAIVASVFLVGPIVVVAWWLNRPKGEVPPGANLTELDVVCLGRVDGTTPVTALEPSAPGKVVEVLVAEGQQVRAKDPLLKLDDEAAKLRVEEAEQALVAAKVEVEVAQLEVGFLPRRKVLQKLAVETAEERAAAARSLVQEREKARNFGTITAAELLAAETEARQMEHLVDIEKARLDELDKSNPSLRVQAAEARRAMAQITLQQTQKAVRDCLLLAPADGVVLRVQTGVGETVAPGALQPALLFRANSPLIIRAELEQEFLGRVKPGMKATIHDDVRADSPTWTGTVQRIGNWVARKRSFVLDPGEVNDVRTVECIIALDGKALDGKARDGKPEALLVGQRMRVHIGQ
jgi:multidrug resistance efflux pump